MLRYGRFILVFFAAAGAVPVQWRHGLAECAHAVATRVSPITTKEGINLNPSISGDGRVVAFESTEDVAGAGGTEAFRAIRANVSVDPATFLTNGRDASAGAGNFPGWVAHCLRLQRQSSGN